MQQTNIKVLRSTTNLFIVQSKLVKNRQKVDKFNSRQIQTDEFKLIKLQWNPMFFWHENL